MSKRSSNDNGLPRAITPSREPDAHGQAALLLVESILHGLIEQLVFSVAQAVELVDIAAEVKSDIGASLGESSATLQQSITLLSAISNSLQYDLPKG